MSQARSCAVLFALPCGLSLGGVTTWAVALANELASRGRRVGMILHRPRAGDRPGEYALDARVSVFRLEREKALAEVLGGARFFERAYGSAIDAMGEGPVVCLPSLMGDCYGLFAACSAGRAARVRVVGWAHLFSPYELRVLEHYAPLISRFVGVSDELCGALRARLPARAAHVANIPYGVEVPAGVERDPPSRLRIAYVGRLDVDVKRADVLPLLSRELDRAGVEHTISIAGDGPAREMIAGAACPSVSLLGALSPRAVGELLLASDVLVLPSRAEGLPLVLQEAMARACVPVVCEGESGISQLIEQDVTGVRVANTEDRSALAAALADGVTRANSLGLARLGRAARDRILGGYRIAECHARMIGTIDLAASDPPRAWPAGVEPMFTSATGGGSGTVPADGAERMRRVLAELKDRRVLVYGTGRHTAELLDVVREFARSIIGFVDDDPARRGARISDLPILSPADAAASGASDVLISSWIHEQAMWDRRAVFEDAGLRVHRLYAD